MFFSVYIFPRASICLEITETARRTAILEAMEPETTTGPGQLAMSGPVIRFALVVTSLLGKLAISSWPPPPSSPLVVYQPVSFVTIRGCQEAAVDRPPDSFRLYLGRKKVRPERGKGQPVVFLFG